MVWRCIVERRSAYRSKGPRCYGWGISRGLGIRLRVLRYKCGFYPVSWFSSIVWIRSIVVGASRLRGKSCSRWGNAISLSSGSCPASSSGLKCGCPGSSWSFGTGAFLSGCRCRLGYQSSIRPNRRPPWSAELSNLNPKRRRILQDTALLNMKDKDTREIDNNFLQNLELIKPPDLGFFINKLFLILFRITVTAIRLAFRH